MPRAAWQGGNTGGKIRIPTGIGSLSFCLNSLLSYIVSVPISSPFQSARFTAFCVFVPLCAPIASSRMFLFPPEQTFPDTDPWARRGPHGCCTCSRYCHKDRGDSVCRLVPNISVSISIFFTIIFIRP